ncbi:MAG: phosphotransferase [Deltaproteobacteria bacterium]|nr:phosphotransferase [Deltaproteobacteria bacterium]
MVVVLLEFGPAESSRIHHYLEGKELIHQQLQKVLRRLWQQEFPSRAIPRHFDFIWERSDRKVLLYVFADGRSYPVFFGKSSDSHSVAKRLCQEATVLNKLKQTDQYLAETIPQPVFCATVGNQTILLEKMIHGYPLSNLIKPFSNKVWWREAKNHFHWVTEWTIQFHKKATEEVFQLSSEGWKEFFRERCREFNFKYGVKIDTHKWEIIDAWLGKCDGLRLPKVIDHGDLTPHQILVTKNNYIVIDWELSPLLGLPGHDLINFFIHYRALIEKRKRFMERDLKDENITALFFDKDTRTPFVDYMRRYFVAMGIHPYFIIPILYARYPRIHLGEGVCKKMVEVLSV